MSALETLCTLASGLRPARGLLHNCRFEGFGVESYGIEAIVELIGKAPFKLSPDAFLVETSNHIAVFDGDRVVFADLFDGNIGRLWVLGPDGFAGNEPLFAAPFDPDMDQAGGDVFFAAADHPDLAGDAAPNVVAAGRMIVAEANGPRTRAFAIRAFGSADKGVVLFAVFRLRLDQQDVAGFHLMAAPWDTEGHHIIRDVGGEAALASSRWCPRVA